MYIFKVLLTFGNLTEGIFCQELNDELETRIRQILRKKKSPRHIPKLIFQTPPDGIPYSFSNKKVEIAITKIIHGMSVANRGALRNPDSLDFYLEMKNKLK